MEVFQGIPKRDPKTLTGLARRVGAVSDIAKSFESEGRGGSGRRRLLPQDPEKAVGETDGGRGGQGAVGWYKEGVMEVMGEAGGTGSNRISTPRPQGLLQPQQEKDEKEKHHHHHHQEAGGGGGGGGGSRRRDPYKDPIDSLHLPRPSFTSSRGSNLLRLSSRDRTHPRGGGGGGGGGEEQNMRNPTLGELLRQDTAGGGGGGGGGGRGAGGVRASISPSRRSTANISQLVRAHPPSTPSSPSNPAPLPPRRPPAAKPPAKPPTDASYELDVDENGATSTDCTENGSQDAITGYTDQPERDSLDGRLPGSSHGGTGNPPPPPAPPSPPPPTTGFSKGPNAKSKKHKKLKPDRDSSPSPPGPSTPSSKKGEKGDKGRGEREMEEGGGFRPKTQPYTYLWVVLSGLYGKVVVLLMLAFTLTEALHNQVLPFTFQGIFLMYLYVGSILAILCIYVTVIIDNCPSVSASKENLTRQDDAEVGSITSFGTLKRAHISRSKTSRTSFYLRVGALVFGLGTLIFNGLEIAMHSTLQSECVKDVVFAHPILQALFTFLQMHFLFVNSEVIVERFGQVARFGFMHLVATNLAVWVRAVVWDAATVWMLNTYGDGKDHEVPPQAEQVIKMHHCFQNNSLGRLWTDAQPYLFPFLVQYSLIAAAVTYVMWCNVGKERLKKLTQNKPEMEDSTTLDKRGVRKGYWKVDCRSASKGLFLGLLCLVGGTVILIIFFVMKDQEAFRQRLFWLTTSTHTLLLSLSILVTVIGFLQVPKLSLSTSSRPLDLDKLLLSATIMGVYIFAIFGMIVGGISYQVPEYLATFCLHLLLLVQVSLQDMLVAEASRRTCTSRYQMVTKPGRQVVTFLLFSNITLWGLDTFMTHSTVSQEFQFGFYGLLAWGVLSRVSLPLLILYRFYSGVILVEIWKNTYRTKAD